MGWNNPPVQWADLERALSGRTAGRSGNRDKKQPGDGGDNPAWTRHRDRYEPPSLLTSTQLPETQLPETQLPETQLPEIQPRIPYAELHCHSNFSFLDGASHPEELVEEAARLELRALALTDHDGVYGIVRFAEAAMAVGLPTVFGAELSLGLTRPQNGVADPEGRHLVVLARDAEGYGRLCRAISTAQMAGKE